MPLLHFASKSTAPAESQLQWGPNAYLTDGVHLLRTLSPPIIEAGEHFLAVEDCGTLDVVLLAQEELAAMQLRLVRPAWEARLDGVGAQPSDASEVPPLWE